MSEEVEEEIAEGEDPAVCHGSERGRTSRAYMPVK